MLDIAERAAKKSAFSDQARVGILLREKLELRLRVRKILSAKIGLGQFHPHLRGKRRARMPLQETRGGRDDVRFIGARGRVVQPDFEIIRAFDRGRSRMALPRARQVFARGFQVRSAPRGKPAPPARPTLRKSAGCWDNRE